DARDRVAAADRVVDEPVELAVHGLEIDGFLRHQVGQVVQADGDAEPVRRFVP
ncbi:conserved hypothetical protein, partial [Ricinus communis]